MKYWKTASLLTLLLVGLAGIVAAKERPNILLVLSDDHSLPHVGAYGCPNCERFSLTPRLDAFAEQGIRFHRAYTAAPQCAPSRTAIFAGRSPVGISATRFAHPARANVPFFTDLLRKSGYWTGLDGRHQHLDGRAKDSPHITETLIELGMKGPEFESRFDHFVGRTSTKGAALSQVPVKFAAALDKVPKGKPFFLYFGFNQPHRRFGEDHEGIDPSLLKLPADWPDLPEVRLDYARFLDDVRDLDTGFGSLMDVLEKRGLSKNTLVIFMGDNGEALLRGKGTLFTRGTNVPLIIRWPGVIEPGTETGAMISGVDLAPTLLEAAGLKAGEGMTGQSFLPALKGESFPGREFVFAERGWHFGPITRTDGFDLSRSVTSRKHHFIYNAIPNRTYTPVDMPKKPAWIAIREAHEKGELSPLHARLYFQNPRPIFELYDLEKDPLQLANLAGQELSAGIEKSLREELDKWMIRESDYLPLPTHAFQQITAK